MLHSTYDYNIRYLLLDGCTYYSYVTLLSTIVKNTRTKKKNKNIFKKLYCNKTIKNELNVFRLSYNYFCKSLILSYTVKITKLNGIHASFRIQFSYTCDYCVM